MKYYKYIDYDALLKNLPKVYSSKQLYYYNIPCAFDIETSSFYNNNIKTAIMYVWQLGINNTVFYGRTWDELIDCMTIIKNKLKLNRNKRIIIYVHNLGYEFQFMRTHFKWYKVFAIDERKPVYAITSEGFEFRCSYILSNYSLDNLGKNLRNKVNKLTGFLDYNLIRTPETSLTNNELSYCENDIRVILQYIKECIEDDKSIDKIPLTNTGYVRRYCRNETIKNKNIKIKNDYKNIISQCVMSVEDFNISKMALMGGFCHSSSNYSGTVCYNAHSMDFTSSYPFIMLCFKFPYGQSKTVKIINEEQFNNLINHYACIFKITFLGLQEKVDFEHILSKSKCYNIKNAIIDNGRVVSADELTTVLTEIDFFAIKQFYKWDNVIIYPVTYWQKKYLPTPLVKSILKLYFDKTELKGVEGSEDIYTHSKSMLNSVYGMCVTNTVKPQHIYNDGWEIENIELSKIIEKENKSKSRFLYYIWGIYVTAYARYNLYTGILELKSDYIYSDTDSVKFLNLEQHKKYFDNYNKWALNKMEKAMKYHNIENFIPKTKNGVDKPIGVWDYEGKYDKFKTLGAKRYLTEKNGIIECTISGVKKSTGSKFISSLNNPFNEFDDGLVFKGCDTGKKTLLYIDEPCEGVIKDYKGNYYEYKELSYIHMEECEYHLNRSSDYLHYLLNYKKK